MRHFDVQMLGGVVLHRGNIAEMVTGEGKTLVATLPAYLNALDGKGVHVVTVNDYLARRDCEWMTPIYKAPGRHRRLHPERHGPRRPPQGLRLRHHLRHQQRVRLRLPARQHEAGPLGRSRITTRTTSSARRPSTTPSSTRWTTSSSTRPARRSSSPARPSATSAATPRPTTSPCSSPTCKRASPTSYFEVKEKEHTCHLTDEGIRKAEELAGVESFYTAGNMEWPHLIDNALKAHHLYHKDKQYVGDAPSRDRTR